MAKWPFNKSGEGEDEDAGKAVEARFGAVDSKLDELSSKMVTKADIGSSVAAAIKAANAEAKAEAARLAKEANDRQQQTEYKPEEAFEEFANDPRGALARANAPATKLALLSLSKQARIEILGEKEYYHGDFKKRVDNMIETGTQDYSKMADVGYITNCYRLVMAEYMEEDKLKDAKRSTSMHSFSDSQNGGRTVDKDAKPTIEFRNNKDAYAAKMLGLEDKDFIDAAKDGAIHGLEVVA